MTPRGTWRTVRGGAGWRGRLQQRDELFDGHLRVADDSFERPAIDFLMHGKRDRNSLRVVSILRVATALIYETESGAFEGARGFSSGYERRFQTATCTTL